MKLTYRAKKYLIVSIIIYTLVLLILTVTNTTFSVYYFTVTGVVIMIVCMESALRAEVTKKERELEALDWLLSEIRHRYYVHGMVDEALREALENCKNTSLRKIIHAMLDVLNSSEPKTALDRFNQKINNRYYGMLLNLSLMVMEFGDKSMEGQSLYLMNLKGLRTELHMEIQQSKTIRHHFVGLTFVIVMPLLSLKLIENWGIHNLEELKTYYEGTYQIIFYISIFVITLCLYYLFYLFKSPIRIIMSQHNFLKWFASSAVIQRISENYEELCAKAARRQQLLLLEVGETLTLSMLLAKRLLMFLLIGAAVALIGIWQFGISNIGFIILFAIALGALAFYVPIWLLCYRRKMMQMYMEDEVLQYHSILMMLMYMDRISTYELLEAMESFAIIFKKPLKACLTEYESGQMKALAHMKEKIQCQAMNKLIDNLMMCDEIGVEKALDELTLEKNFYNEKRKQQNEYNLEKKGVLCKFLAFLPLAITITFYLILPFIAVSLSKLVDISQEIANGKG